MGVGSRMIPIKHITVVKSNAVIAVIPGSFPKSFDKAVIP